MEFLLHAIAPIKETRASEGTWRGGTLQFTGSAESSHCLGPPEVGAGIRENRERGMQLFYTQKSCPVVLWPHQYPAILCKHSPSSWEEMKQDIGKEGQSRSGMQNPAMRQSAHQAPVKRNTAYTTAVLGLSKSLRSSNLTKDDRGVTVTSGARGIKIPSLPTSYFISACKTQSRASSWNAPSMPLPRWTTCFPIWSSYRLSFHHSRNYYSICMSL